MSTTVLAFIIAITMALVEIVKRLLDSLIKKFNDKDMDSVAYETRDNIRNLCQVIEKVDSEGYHLLYTPRSLDITQKEILKSTQEISNTQKMLCQTMERITAALDRIDRRHNHE